MIYVKKLEIYILNLYFDQFTVHPNDLVFVGNIIGSLLTVSSF